MARRMNKKVSIAVPASIVSDIPHLREKTSKVGLIGRTAAIFRINEIVIYSDDSKANQEADMNLVTRLLSYMETPQYLRKKLFRIRPELRYVGVLPPLRTPHHPLNRKMKNLKVGECRDGVTISNRQVGSLVDIGVEKPALVPSVKLPANKRVTLRITKINNQVEAELASREKMSEYWGYTVRGEKCSFAELVKTREFDLILATSKYGTDFKEVADSMARRWEQADSILIGFGAPTQGLHEIVAREGFNLGEVSDFIVNTIPMQGTETVRTEEALIASLAIFRLHFYS